ncbi:MAG: hypothetical protein QW318_03450 [Candidatus Caldarchaeum sp.]|jgi:hypothetical protein
MRLPLISFAAVSLVSMVLATAIGPAELIKIIYTSPQGLVLLGRLIMVYQVVYPATGNQLLSAYAAIVFNNATGLMMVFASPVLIHASHKMTGRWRMLGGNGGWKLFRTGLRFISSFYMAMLALPLAPAIALRGFALFIPFEFMYVFIAAHILYKASQLESGEFRTKYYEMLSKNAPIAALLLLFAAVMEAVEAV